MVRVRIAPSPTGVPHLGNTRTALFNWLFAKHHHGKFILRIEDTDRRRFVPESISAIYEILEWLGLECDESPVVGGDYGPYVQSQRLEIYQKYVKQLVENGNAYFCFCTPERLEGLRKQAELAKKPVVYDRLCFNLSKTEVRKRIASGKTHVVRMKIPSVGKTEWTDLIHGQISFENSLLDDAIILKADGYPTYHLAVVVDDHLMKITHVLRGDEWISSTPKHLLLYKFLGFNPPKFGHFPLILGPDKTKLSKRHGAMSVIDYKNLGYLPEAIINFLALLGWSPKTDQEIFSINELVEAFDLDGVNPTSPVFNIEKLNWFNKQWIMKISQARLLKYLDQFIPDTWDRKLIVRILPLVKERITTLADFKNWSDFFFDRPAVSFRGLDKELVIKVLDLLGSSFSKLTDWKVVSMESEARKSIGDLKPRVAFEILRIAVTGKRVGPPLFESLEILGQAETVERIATARSSL